MFEQTASLWRRLLGKPQPVARDANTALAEDERRIWVRFPADLETRVIAPQQQHESGVGARICDISRGGARVIVKHEFEPGSLLTVVLPSSNGKSALSVLACVVHCRAGQDGEWHLGCSFSAELDDDDLAVFGATKVRPTAPDGRSWTRFPCDVTATFQRLSDNDPKQHAARVRDISASGVALLVDAEVPAGTLLSAELNGAQHKTFSILACVVHVSEAPEGGWVLGCNFIRELNTADLQLLM